MAKSDEDRVMQVNSMTSANEITIVSFIEKGKRVVKIGASHIESPETDDVRHVKALGGYVDVKALRKLLIGA